MASRLNEILATGTTPYPVLIQTGDGTANTAETYDFRFTGTPILLVRPNASGSQFASLNSVTESATGHTVVGSQNFTYTYIAIGLRE